MLVIPFENKPSLSKLPIVTILLIAANCLIFFFYQSGDDDYVEQALGIYEEGDLFEYEEPVFRIYLEENSRDELALVDPEDPNQFYYLVLFDTAFSHFLRTYWSDNPEKADPKWLELRERFEESRNSISRYSYGLIPADIK